MCVLPWGDVRGELGRDRAGTVAAEGHDARVATRVIGRVELEPDEGQGRQARSRPVNPMAPRSGSASAAALGLASGVAPGDGDALSGGVTVAPAEGDPIAIGGALGDARPGAAAADDDQQRHGDDQHQQAGQAGHDGAQGSVAHGVESSMRAGIVPDRRRHAARWSVVTHTTPGDHGRLIDRPASPCPVRPG